NANGANVNTGRNVNSGAGANGNLNQNTPGNGNGNQRGGGATPTATATPSPTVSPTPTPDLNAEGRKNKLSDSGWYYFLITLMFAAVLIPFAMVITRAIRFSKATFNSPLGLP